MFVFARTSLLHTAWATLIAVVFVVLLPMTVHASRAASGATPDAIGLSAICTLGGARIVLPDAGGDSDSRPLAHQQPCAFCTSVVPVFADQHTPRVVAVIDGMAVVIPLHPVEWLPPDVAAIQPLSPRAPPRI